MGVNSITARKLSAIVPRIFNKKEAFISGRFLRVSSSGLFMFNEHLIHGIFSSPILFNVKGMKSAEMFFEDCVGPSKSAI